MAEIKVTNECHEAMRLQTPHGEFTNPGRKVTDGWIIKVDDDLLARLQKQRAGNESISDTIIRICHTYRGTN